MSPRFRSAVHEYELLPRASLESQGPHDLAELERHASNSSWISRLAGVVPLKRISKRSTYAHYITPRRRKRSILRLIYWSVFSFPWICLFLVLFASIFVPSYTRLPAHYKQLRRLSLASADPGRANPHNEKVFIAASIYEVNGTLTSGAWGKSVLELVDLLGPDNVHLSIYENDPDALSRQSLIDLRRKVTCNSSIVYEHLDLNTLPRTTLPNGETKIKRIAFLAEVRNRALAPLDKTGTRFDRLLYINDVNFNPIDAAQLLLSTNVDASGRANYAAACAVDFINAFKFYDRFATRDMGGYNMGIPFYPWFTSAGDAVSRNDVIRGTDAVRVRSCWGGMTAYEAKWFQDQQLLDPPSPNPVGNTTPLRFRYEEDTFWESSECCLVNADLQYRRSGIGMPSDTGIYMNPFVRVAYDTTTLSWLSLTRRPEHLYPIIHDILNHFVGFPTPNERQTEKPGQRVTDKEWVYDDPNKAFAPNATAEDRSGHYEQVQRVAGAGGFCSGKQLLVINEDRKEGDSLWYKINIVR